MKIPNKIKIMGHSYKIEEAPLIKIKGTSGDSCVNTQTIRLDPTVISSHKEETFLHEIIEMLIYHLSVPLKHTTLAILSEGLYQVLHDNKLIFFDEEKD